VSNSTRRPAGGKDDRPEKPRADFPLYPHKVGRWAKKVKGRTVYFTSWRDDPKGVAALEQWLEQKDDLLAGREPRANREGLTVADLCNQFLTHKAAMRDNGELHARTFGGYYRTCQIVVKHFRRDRLVVDLSPDDFRQLRIALARTRGLSALGTDISRVRSIFKFAFDEGLILAPVRFGKAFGKPRQEKIDAAREAHRAEHGPRMFEAHEIRAILAACGQPLKSMVLLAANTAFGNSDLACLPVKAVDLDAGWVTFPRVKTAVARRVPLWPETIEAVREWLPMRPKAKDKADSGLLFLTRKGGRWVFLTESGAPADSISQEFTKVLRTLGLKRPRVSFYALRHTFETIAGETLDQVAVDCVMGHKIRGMKANYIERIGDDRLRRVVDHVRAWVFDAAPGDASSGDKHGEHVETAEQTTTEPGAPRLKLFAG